MSPVPGSDEIGRTKHPPALTIKFATFSRKATPNMMAVGGLPAEMVVHMLVSTRMSPQYGESVDNLSHTGSAYGLKVLLLWPQAPESSRKLVQSN